MFLKLHYKESGREFLVNINAIDGIEINGSVEHGCVLTIASIQGGERAHETVAETFQDIERWLLNARLMAN
jgi:hypothetical protein